MARDWVHKVREAMQVSDTPGVFVLGSFERRVTFYSQQVRALNLLDSLISLGRLGPGKHVVVVGAGVAGLTFAAAAARRGVEVTVLEKEDRPFSLFRYAPNRWLHPRIYDWPLPGWGIERAGLPVLDWSAGTVAQAAQQLEAGWKSIRSAHGALIHEVYRAREVKFRKHDGGMWVSWNEESLGRKSRDRGSCCALVVLAVGFGQENAAVPGYRNYWEPDDLDSDSGFIPDKSEPRSWLVSGSGDGALTDLLRLCIRGFRHERMVHDFVAHPQIDPIVEQIRAIEDDPRAHDPEQPRFLHEAYQNLEAPFVINLLHERLRKDTRVTLNAENPFYFQRGSSVLNRFLVAQLRHAGGFDFLPGRLISVKEEMGKLRVSLDDGTEKEFDRVVPRHGPRPTAIEEHFPNIWKSCQVIRERWKQAPNLLDQTRERYWEKGVFGPEERPEDTSPHANTPKESASSLPSRTWKPLFAHALEPAKHFKGRQALVTELDEWLEAPASPTRVFALCAAGGTGKTAIIEHALTGWLQKRQAAKKPLGGGLFVWSFYDNNRIEYFLGEACSYFLGKAGAVNGRLERLLTELQSGAPHLLVLDGLETVQTPGGVGRARGEIEDRQLKRLVSLVASMNLGGTRLLVTSRFPLCELRDLSDPARYREEPLEELEQVAARELLRAWGVEGTDSTLDRLAEKVGRHALSVRVLGAYLARFRNGDSKVGLALDLGEALREASEADAKAAKLSRLLAHYAKAMKPVERELMARLSMFPRGVAADTLAALANAGGEVAGVLAGYNKSRILKILERLVKQDLAFTYRSHGRQTFTAHPFVRDTFRKLTGVRAEEVHEVIRRKLAPTLKGRPGQMLLDPRSLARYEAALDRYEALIEHTRLAGKAQEAFEIFWHGLGGYQILGIQLGENTRGLRILSSFVADGSPADYCRALTSKWRGRLANSLGLFAETLGDLPLAEQSFARAAKFDRQQGDMLNLSMTLQNAAELELLQGRLPQASFHLDEALAHAKKVGDTPLIATCHADIAWAYALAGERNLALTHFVTATRFTGGPLYDLSGLRQAVFRRLSGDVAGALEQSLANLEMCEAHGWTRTSARLQVLLGQLALPGDLAEARRLLELARDWTQRSGDMEVILWAHLLAAEIASAAGRPQEALAEAERGRVQADACGFGLSSIDLRLAAARAHVAQGSPHDALRYVKEALVRASNSECGYAWGRADAEHLAGLALCALGEKGESHARFRAAAELRGRLHHPGAAESLGMV